MADFDARAAHAPPPNIAQPSPHNRLLPMSLPHIDLLYSLSGLFVGILVGLTGVGGGSLMTPILVLLFGVHPATAVGTDLLYAAATRPPARSSMA